MASRFLSPAYEVMASAASPVINFGRGILGYQDPFLTQTMQDRMLELEAQKGPSGSIGYEDYGLVSGPGGRFTGGLPSLLLSNPIDFGLAGSIGRYGYGPDGRTGLEYDFTPDQDTGSTGSGILDFINRGGVKNYISNLDLIGNFGFGTPAAASEVSIEEPSGTSDMGYVGIPGTADDFFGSGFSATPDMGYPSVTRGGPQTFQDFYESTYDPYNPEKDDYQVEKIQGPKKTGIAGLMEFMGNIPTPLNLLRRAFEGRGPGFIGPKGSRPYDYNESTLSTFGRSRTGAEFFQNMRDKKAREEAAKRGAAKQKAKNLDYEYDAYTGGGGGGGGIGSSSGGAASPGSQGPGGSDEMGSF